MVLQLPPIDQLDILQRMARHLDRSHVSRMVLRPNIIVLQDSGRVEDLHKRLAGRVQCARDVGHPIEHHGV